MTFGEFVRSERTKKGWKQIELAEKAMVCNALISRIERKAENPTMHAMERICKALGKTYMIEI